MPIDIFTASLLFVPDKNMTSYMQLVLCKNTLHTFYKSVIIEIALKKLYV